MGCYGVMQTVQALCDKQNIVMGQIEVRCNSFKAFYKAFDLDQFSPNHTHYELMHEISSNVKVSPILWKAGHVQEHQDTNPFHMLNFWALLYVDMNMIVQDYLKETQDISILGRLKKYLL